MLKQRQFLTGWLKLRLKNIESYIDFNVILQWEFCRHFCIVTCLFYARRAGQASFSLSLQRAVMNLYLSVEHVLRPGCSLLSFYYILTRRSYFTLPY